MRRAAQSTNTPGVPLKDNGASDETMFQLTPFPVTAGEKGWAVLPRLWPATPPGGTRAMSPSLF